MKLHLNLALTELRRVRDVSINNAPIHEQAGDLEQAMLCWNVASQCIAAIDIINQYDGKKLK
jgi:hypothetical protein